MVRTDSTDSDQICWSESLTFEYIIKNNSACCDLIDRLITTNSNVRINCWAEPLICFAI